MSVNCSYTQIMPIEDIKLNPKNRNKHTDDQITRLAKLIDFYGCRHPVIVSELNNECVAGEGRLLAMKKLGWASVPVDF